MAGLAQRVAVVTGAAIGLGRAISQAIAPTVAGLVLVDRDGDKLHATARELQGVTAVETLVAEMTDPATPAAVVDLAGRLGGADVLVNNAGIVSYAPFFDTTPEQLRSLLRIDVESVYFMSQAFARALVLRGAPGVIVNIGTGHAITGVGGTSAYAAAKGAIHALTRALAVELAPHAIRVNTLALGTTMTERVRTEIPQSTLDGRMKQIPLGRAATPDEAARAVAFLIEAEYSTGAELLLDGGFTIFGDR